MRFFWGFFFLANAPASDKKDLLSELDVMKKLKPHPHVIKLVGYVTETGKFSFLKFVAYKFSWRLYTANDSNDRAF